MKKILIVFALVAIMMFPLTAHASENVTADISPFSHNIVFTDFYNYAVEYPVLLYRNVSYIPLTSSMCNELYLSVAFTPEDGLYVARGGGRGNIGTERNRVLGSINYTNPANGKVEALIPDYPVFINGREYDSKDAEYPMLNFRGITYLPLTYDIITKEFDFDFSFDNEKKHLTLHGNSWYSSPSFIACTDEYLEIEDYKSVYSESVDENGFTVYHHEYDYSDYYRISLADDAITKMPSDYKPDRPDGTVKKENDPRFAVRDGYAYFLDTPLVKLPDYGKDYVSDASAKIYDYDDISFIVVNTWSSVPLPRGTTSRHYIFVTDGDVITKLDWNYTFNGILYNGKDIWYFISNSGEQGYGNSFADIYAYTVEKGLERVSDRYENINSLEYIGEKDGKMYVFAALREGNRDIAYSGESLNPIYSGYYVIDEDLTITKISPYMGSRTTVLLAENGNLYAITNYSSQNHRIINLNTGRIIAEL